jgi:putative SbcD/Mre11-related phosphoesterase
VWLSETRSLVVADLHLGYAWAHRHSGQMMPLSVPDDTVERLLALLGEYPASELILLGDIVHRAIPLETLEGELARLAELVGSIVEIRWIAGNHDKALDLLLRKIPGKPTLKFEHRCGPHILTHGDATQAAGDVHLELVRLSGGRVFIGHEHPAFGVSDRVTTCMKCPCFAMNDQVIALPAFSSWAAGTDIRRRDFLSTYFRTTAPRHAVACIAGKLLPMKV